MSDEIKIPDDLAKQLFDRGDCSLDAAKIIARWMREECAKVAEQAAASNPSEGRLSLLAESIRKVGST